MCNIDEQVLWHRLIALVKLNKAGAAVSMQQEDCVAYCWLGISG